MSYKEPERQREFQREWRNSHRRPAVVADYRERKRAIAREAKSQPCADCGVSYPYYVMDLDHRPGETKVTNMSTMIINAGMDALIAEIAKCDAVCANCHRFRTHDRGYHNAKQSPEH